MTIRPATEADKDQIWQIFHDVIQTEDTYVFPADTPRADLDRHWFADYMTTFVAEEDGLVLGTYIIKPNQIGLGNHIANGSYMVSSDARGRGVGRALCEHSIEYARESGYRAIQFNIVVSTNEGAVRLWQRCGFEIIGTTPKAFRHPQLGYVDAHIMYREV